jgi:hypothetical protein
MAGSDTKTTTARFFSSALLVASSLVGCGSDEQPSSNASDAGGSNEPSALVGSCPSGFVVGAGRNTGFVSDGVDRTFHVMLPAELTTPRPLFVSLTGTVQEELAFATQSGLAELPSSGWIVVAPVRICSQAGTNCAQVGGDGRIWEPWYDGTTGGAKDDEGPDVRFVEAMVRCAASTWPVDKNRIYVGGISAGGSFTNRNLTFNSDFFAGGVPSSGNWYSGAAAPATATTMDRSIVILIWGGPTDVWPATNPLANYDPETRLAAEYYAAQSNVVTVACSGTHGHVWPTVMTPWLATTLLSHPKGSAPAAFKLTEPPTGFSCVLGKYTDH